MDSFNLWCFGANESTTVALEKQENGETVALPISLPTDISLSFLLVSLSLLVALDGTCSPFRLHR